MDQRDGMLAETAPDGPRQPDETRVLREATGAMTQADQADGSSAHGCAGSLCGFLRATM